MIRALNAGAERLFAAVVDPDDGWQPMQGVERAVATPAGVELRVHASDLSDAQAQALAEAIADMLRAAGVREALVTLPEGAPREPAPAPAHVGAAAEAYAEEAWARAAALLEPPPGARPLTVVALPGASSLTASYALAGGADAALEHFPRRCAGARRRRGGGRGGRSAAGRDAHAHARLQRCAARHGDGHGDELAAALGAAGGHRDDRALGGPRRRGRGAV